MGLAYSGLTSQWKGSDPSSDSERVPYDPIFTTMYKQNLTSAMFSMAIQRQSGGYIAFGGLPPVNVTGDFVKTDIQMMQSSLPGDSGSQYLFYTMTPDAFVYSGSSGKNQNQYIVDSGTTLLYAATEDAQAINKAFQPAATQDQSSGLYSVDCKAQAPDLGVTIAGTTFKINPTDMIMSNGDGTCISGVQDGGSQGPFILGDVFMQSVVVVFDVGASQLRFAVHDY